VVRRVPARLRRLRRVLFERLPRLHRLACRSVGAGVLGSCLRQFGRTGGGRLHVGLAGVKHLGVKHLGVKHLSAVVPGLKGPGVDRLDVRDPGVEHLIVELLLANPPVAETPVIGRAISARPTIRARPTIGA